MSDISVHVHASGPIFDGKAEEAANRIKDEVEQKIADKAKDTARAFQLASIKVETTGAEPASLHVEQSDFGHVVTDAYGIVYGPWLEGTGSRNETTRFKGYHAMRKATSVINDEAEALAEEAISELVKEMN